MLRTMASALLALAAAGCGSDEAEACPPIDGTFQYTTTSSNPDCAGEGVVRYRNGDRVDDGIGDLDCSPVERDESPDGCTIEGTLHCTGTNPDGTPFVGSLVYITMQLDGGKRIESTREVTVASGGQEVSCVAHLTGKRL